MLNTNNWKYEVGDLLCCPRGGADDVWGAVFVINKIQAQKPYYECWSQRANRLISLPKETIEEGWYVPKENNKKAT